MDVATRFGLSLTGVRCVDCVASGAVEAVLGLPLPLVAVVEVVVDASVVASGLGVTGGVEVSFPCAVVEDGVFVAFVGIGAVKSRLGVSAFTGSGFFSVIFSPTNPMPITRIEMATQ